MSLRKNPGSDVAGGIRIEWLSTTWMVVEAAVAIFAGVKARSVALTAFGADSLIELVASGALLWRLAVEARGAESDRVALAERIASWIVGVALLLLAVYIAVSSGRSLWLHEGPETAPLGIALTAASSLIMPLLARSKKRIGRRIGSKALEADGSCSMVCAYMSWIVLAGTLLTALLQFWWVDSVAALALVYFVASEGREAIEEARRASPGR